MLECVHPSWISCFVWILMESCSLTLTLSVLIQDHNYALVLVIQTMCLVIFCTHNVLVKSYQMIFWKLELLSSVNLSFPVVIPNTIVKQISIKVLTVGRDLNVIIKKHSSVDDTFSTQAHEVRVFSRFGTDQLTNLLLIAWRRLSPTYK